jgi:hypothetical protein
MLLQANGLDPYIIPTPKLNDVSITFTIGIHFLSTYTLNSAPVKLYATTSYPIFLSLLKLEYFNVEITYFNSAGYSVSNPTPIETLLKITDVLRG